MTEAEIENQAEEYASKITDELKNKGFLAIGEISQRYAGIVQGVKWGMEHTIEWHDLRKDPNDLPREAICMKDGKIAELEKENARLKADLDNYKALDSHYDEIEEDSKWIAEENEQLKVQIEKMKTSFRCIG